jgi:hypothetical protein
MSEFNPWRSCEVIPVPAHFSEPRSRRKWASVKTAWSVPKNASPPALWSIAPRLTEKREPVAALFRRNLVRADNPAGSEIGTLFFEQRLPATDVVEGISFPSACCFPGLFRKPGKQLLAPRFGVNTVGSAGGRSSTWI